MPLIPQMPQILTPRLEMPLPALQSALRRVRARQVTLVFPLNRRPAIATASAMQALASFCNQLGKEIAVVGGDELLRALAVTVGFVGATSLEDDVVEEDPASARRPAADEWEWADARFRADQAARVTRPLGLNEFDEDELDEDVILVLLDEPPDYIQPLLKRAAGDTTRQDINRRAIPLMRRSGRTTRKLAALEEEEALRFVYETDEDGMTSVIRATGGSSQPPGEGVLTLVPRNPEGD